MDQQTQNLVKVTCVFVIAMGIGLVAYLYWNSLTPYEQCEWKHGSGYCMKKAIKAGDECLAEGRPLGCRPVYYD